MDKKSYLIFHIIFSLFLATKELSDIPLQAAKAYQNIVDAILAADVAAREAERAAENAYQQVCRFFFNET